MSGSATLSAGNATTNNSGYASVTVHSAHQTADVLVSACVAPGNAPCVTFTLLATPSSLWTLELVSGTDQVVPAQQAFQPLVARVTDGSTAANPVMGASVVFNTLIVRLPPGYVWQNDGDNFAGGTGTPVVLGTSAATAVSTQDGLASITPGPGSVRGPCDLLISIAAGTSTAQVHLRIVAAAGSGTGSRWRWPGGWRTGPTGPVAESLLFAVPEVLGSETSSEPESNSDSRNAQPQTEEPAVSAAPDDKKICLPEKQKEQASKCPDSSTGADSATPEHH